MTQRTISFSLFFSYLLLISSCRSPLSEGDLSDLSVIDARIEILQDLTDKKKNEVTVLLYDKDGKPIRNKSIKLKVNDSDLVYREKQELYYTTTSQYSVSDIPVEDAYNVEIILANGEPNFLGSIKSLAESNGNDIVCDEKGDFNKDHVISWNHLKDINELTIGKSVLLSTSTKMEQNYDSEPQVVTKIGSSGIYVIPKADYITPKSTISIVEVKFSAMKFGTMNKELLKGSEIKIYGHIDKVVNFDEQSKQ